MTTIAFKSARLAGDSCHTDEPENPEGNEGAYCYRYANKLVVTEHVAYGTSGDADCHEFHKMLRALQSPADLPDWEKRCEFEDVRAIICFRTGEIYMIDDGELAEFGPEDAVAIGSGRKFAYGAMDDGAPALRAVQRASQRCLHTRPPFYEFDTFTWKYV